MNFKSFWGILALLLLWACNNGNNSDSLYEKQGEKVIYKGDLTGDVVSHIMKDPTTMHPLISTETFAEEMDAYIYEKLLFLSPEKELQPHLAKALPDVSEDGLTYTFEIREEAKWPDGRDLTAEDVIFSFKTVAFPLAQTPNYLPYMDPIKDMEVDPDNPKKVIITYLELNNFNPYMGALVFILDRNYYDPNNVLGDYSFADLKNDATLQEDPKLIEWTTEYNDPKYGTDPVHLQNGSGPYHITNWDPGQEIVLTPNANYWAKGREEAFMRQDAPSITFRVIKDEQAIIQSLRQQTLDVSFKISSSIYPVITEDSTINAHYDFVKIPRGTASMIVLNNIPDGVNHALIFNDKRVRKAMAFAMDLDDILFRRLKVDGTRVASPVTPNNPYYDKDLPLTSHNPDSARALLAAAGWSDSDGDGILDKTINGELTPLRFTLLNRSTSKLEADLVREIASDLKAFGFDCQPDGSGFKMGQLLGQQYDAVLLPLSVPSIAYPFHQIWTSDAPLNFPGYANEEVDRLSEELRKVADVDEAFKLAQQIQQIMREDLPIITLFNPMRKMIAHKRYNDVEFVMETPFIFLNDLEVIKE